MRYRIVLDLQAWLRLKLPVALAGPSLRLRRRGPTRTAWGAVARCLLPALAAGLEITIKNVIAVLFNPLTRIIEM